MTIESALHSHISRLSDVVDNSPTDATVEEVAGRFGQDVQYFQQPNKATRRLQGKLPNCEENGFISVGGNWWKRGSLK